MPARDINKIIIHCSASEHGDVEVIDSWHRARGWREIGYHYVILNGKRSYEGPFNRGDDGLIERGRDLEEVGAHCKGHNTDSMGVCLIGDHHFTINQIRELVRFVRLFSESLDLNLERDIYCHSEFNQGKTCPNIKPEDLERLLKTFGG